MATKTYKAKIKLTNGNSQDITIEADSPQNAKAMIESQFGQGSIIAGPIQVS